MRIFSATLATDRNSRLLGLRTTAALILMLGLATLTTGWRKSDTLGAAVGIGQQLAPAVLEAKQANAKHKAAEKNRPEAETLCIEKIKSDPDSTFDHINEFVHTYILGMPLAWYNNEEKEGDEDDEREIERA